MAHTCEDQWATSARIVWRWHSVSGLQVPLLPEPSLGSKATFYGKAICNDTVRGGMRHSQTLGQGAVLGPQSSSKMAALMVIVWIKPELSVLRNRKLKHFSEAHDQH